MQMLHDSATASTAAQRDTPMTEAVEAAAEDSPCKGGDSLHHQDEEEAVYVLLDLDNLEASGQLRPGQTLELSGLDTFQPTVKLPDGTTCAAAYEETVGSCMLFGISSDGAGAGPSGEQPQRKLEYVCSTEQLLRARRPPAQKPP